MSKCENCLHKKDCIDGVNFKYAKQCERFVPDDRTVIKALECCVLYKQICPETCPMADVRQCQIALKKNVFDLIKRQQAEIESLQNQNRILSDNADTAYQDGLNEMRELVKPEIIKEFAERLKKKSQLMALSVYAEPERAVYVSDIDNLVKEMG